MTPSLLASLWQDFGLGSVDLPWLLLGARVGLDVPGRTFLLVSLVLWAVVGLGYARWWWDDQRTRRWALATFAGHMLVHVALDAATFQMGFALMGLASYGLIMARRTPEADVAARRYLAFVVVGEVLLFAGLALAYGTAGGGKAVALASAMSSAQFNGAAMTLVVLALGIKSAVVPLHGWLPSAYVAAPLPARVVLAGAMINAGVLGWLRFLPFGALEAEFLVPPVAVLGLAGAVYGGVRGALSRDARAALAYSSISQMGMVTIGLAMALAGAVDAPRAIAIYGTHHGLAKGTLFLGLGLALAVRDRTRRQVAVAVLALPGLALIGAPLTSGSLAKAQLKGLSAALPESLASAFGVVATLVLVGTAVIVARVLLAAWTDVAVDDTPPAGRVVWVGWVALVLAVLAAAWWVPALVGL
jgi:hydrogenase-4 component B